MLTVIGQQVICVKYSLAGEYGSVGTRGGRRSDEGRNRRYFGMFFKQAASTWGMELPQTPPENVSAFWHSCGVKHLVKVFDHGL